MNPENRSQRIIDQYREHYRLLGLDSTDGWDQLRRAYKKQMWRWHPDRFGDNEPEKLKAEDRAKEINRAYQALAKYYDQHGRMPVESPSPERTRPPFRPDVHSSTAASSSRAGGSAPSPAADDGKSVWLRRFVVLSIALIGAYLLTEKTIVPPDVSQPAAHLPGSPDKSVTGTDSAHTQAFGVGSTVGEVYAIQGVPDRVSGDVWHYGEARVHFEQGRVTHWTDSGDRRLKASNETQRPVAANRTFFGKGSTKDEVRALQGAPLRESGNVWDYGLSRVHFDSKEQVIGWEESPLDPLRVKR